MLRQANCLGRKKKFDKRKTPQGRDYYWLAGDLLIRSWKTDEWALKTDTYQ
jgi:5'-nucleotidase